MELTKEYFDQITENLATKEDLKPLATKQDVREGVEELARIISETIATPMEKRFASLEKKLDVEKDVAALKVDMVKIKEALHIQ
jgi:hypothetical protein